MSKRENGAARIIAVIAVIALLAALGIVIWRFWDDIRGWFVKDDGARIAVEVDGTVYKTNGGGLVLMSGDAIGITVGKKAYGLKDCEIEIRAAEGKNFSYTVGEDPYQWWDVTGEDFTRGFTFTETEGKITVTYGSLKEILKKVHDTEELYLDTAQDLTGDLFEMVIRVGKQELVLGFAVGLPPTGVQILPNGIVF